MPERNRKFGDWGESLAEDFLRKRGYDILERNFQKRSGEIDIIARKGDVLHFVEVKTRTISGIKNFGFPQEAVTFFKQKKISDTAIAYLAENHPDENISWQIDVVSIIYSEKDKKADIALIANVFEGNEP